MNRADRLVVGALALVFVIVLGAMVAPSHLSIGPAATPTPGPVTPYREGIVGHPSSVNPLTARTQADRDLVALLFRGLVRAGPDGSILPDLASSWTLSADGRTYTFQLAEDAYWDDGQPVTSADVVFTVGVLQDPTYDGPYGSSWQGIRVKAAGPYAVTVTMVLVVAGFLRQATLPILPEHLLGQANVAALADSSYSARPVGDGPYRILELDYWHALLQRVPSANPAASASPAPAPTPSALPSPGSASQAPSSGGPTTTPLLTPQPSPTPSPTPPPSPRPALQLGPGLARLDSIELRFFDDSASAAAQFKAAQLDGVGGLLPDSVDAALARSGSSLASYRWTSLLGVVVNQRATHPEFADADVRIALLAAIDRTSLVAGVLENRGTQADLPIPSWSSFYDRGAVGRVAYDPAAARAGLSDAGWKLSDAGWVAPHASSTYGLRLLTPDEASNPIVHRVAVAVAAAWTAVGLAVTLQAVPAARYLQLLDTGDFDAAVVDFSVGLDPDLGPLLLSTQVGSGGSNVAGIQDRVLDQLLLGARKTLDPAARQAAVSAVEKYVSGSMPILPLAFQDYGFVLANRVRNVFGDDLADPSSRYWDVIDWRLASDG